MKYLTKTEPGLMGDSDIGRVEVFPAKVKKAPFKTGFLVVLTEHKDKENQVKILLSKKGAENLCGILLQLLHPRP